MLLRQLKEPSRFADVPEQLWLELGKCGVGVNETGIGKAPVVRRQVRDERRNERWGLRNIVLFGRAKFQWRLILTCPCAQILSFFLFLSLKVECTYQLLGRGGLNVSVMTSRMSSRKVVSPFLSWVLLRFNLAMMDSSKNYLCG